MIDKHKEGSVSSSVQEGSVMKQMNTNIGNTRSLEFIVKVYK